MYLKYEIEDEQPYLFYLEHYKTTKAEFYIDDGIEFNLHDVGPVATGCYAGKGRLRNGADAQALQAKLDYPIFIQAPHDFKEPDGVFNDYYIEIPIVMNGDMLTRYNYTVLDANAATEDDSIANHLFWEQADWENYWDLAPGTFNQETHGKDFSKLISITDSKQNPGILYLMYPYYGPLPDAESFTEEHYSGEAILKANVLTGGSVPQVFEIGQCFRHASRGPLAGPYDSYLKMSVVSPVNSTDGTELIDGYKSVVYSMNNISGPQIDDVLLRIALTTPLETPVTFTLDLEPAFSTLSDTDLINSIPAMRDKFGLVDSEHSILAVTPTPGGIPNTEFVPRSQQITIPAGQQFITIPIVLKRPVDGRYAVLARVHSFADRTMLKVLNNDVLITNTMHASNAYDDNMLSVIVEAEVYDGTQLVYSGALNSNNSVDLPKDIKYTVKFKIKYYDRLKSEYRLSQGDSLSVSDKYTPDKHHKFLIDVKSDGNVTSSITSLESVIDRHAPGWILAGDTFSNSVYTIPKTILGSDITFDFDFGHNYLIKDGVVTSNSTMNFNLKLI